METNKNLIPIISELSSRRMATQHFSYFISQSYLKVPKTIRLNTTHYFYYENT